MRPNDKKPGAPAEREQPLADRAALAARAELRGERSGILGVVGSPDFLRR